jgi:DNA polymerase-3 subunit gamma/tau
MESHVFYRKWRPKSFAEVAGQEHVTRTLRNAVSNQHIAHAYLFCGPRGSGKTSTARILAKAVNCLEPKQGEPCNKCDLCLSVNEGNALDIIEIDAASNRGIDEIRELREKVNYAPNSARYKVYIIDEVHMITKDASNAFLKTLEEPPPHAIFILATTEPHKVLTTILSRCQRFDFHRLSRDDTIAKLNLVCEKENIEIEPAALRLIAKVTTGSLRDAENLLEQLTVYYDNNINLQQVQALLGISGDLRVREVAKNIIDKDITAGLTTINSVSAEGLDLRQFNRELVDYLRDLLLVKSGSETVVDVTADDLTELKNLASKTNLDYLLTVVKQFGEINFRSDTFSPLPMELALVESVLSVETMETPAEVAPKKQTETAPKAKTPEKQPAPIQTTTIPDSQFDEKTQLEKSDIAMSEEKTHENSIDKDLDQDIAYIRSHWREFIKSLHGEGSSGNLDAFLRSACEPVAIEDGAIVLGFYYTFHKEKIEDNKYRHLVERKLTEVFGKPYKVRCILYERKKKDHMVKAAQEMMGATVINEREGDDDE